MSRATAPVATDRSRSLEAHLEQENPLLLQVLANFRKLDKLGRRMALLGVDDSYTQRVSWWPVIEVLGTFSSGKSTFLNSYLGEKLQLTGNQAVDDRFTAICYSAEGEGRTLPGAALDADPRFPFFRISEEIEDVSSGEGARVDSYLQLKTSPSERLKRKIFLDSPGFDADRQRDATLRITDRIIDLSDLVLVMFDARHPEPGAMRDTLAHLVGSTVQRSDASKFLYILNQLDAAATEDNPEDVVAAWQRALAAEGLTAGRFYRIYDEDVAGPMADAERQARFKAKKDEDLAEIYHRIQQVEVRRAYRVVDILAQTARDIEETKVPWLKNALKRWRRRVWLYDGIVIVLAALLTLGCYLGLTASTKRAFAAIGAGGAITIITIIVLFILAVVIHFSFRRLAARQIARKLAREAPPESANDLVRAFRRNTRWSRNMLAWRPAGWGFFGRRLIKKTLDNRTDYVQDLNDRFANPAGGE
jgi:uncharacterized membrane protein